MHCLWRGPTIIHGRRPQEAARNRATLSTTLTSSRPLAWPSHCLLRAAASGASSEASAASRQLLRAENLVVVIAAIVVAIMTTDIMTIVIMTTVIMTTDITTIVIMTTDITWRCRWRSLVARPIRSRLRRSGDGS